MQEISIKVLLRGSKSVRFTIPAEKQNEVLDALTNTSKPEKPWIEIESIRQGNFHLKTKLIAGVQVRTILSTKKKAATGVTLKQIAAILDVEYFSLTRRVNKPGTNSIQLKLGTDRRVLLTPENFDALGVLGITPEQKLSLLEAENNEFRKNKSRPDADK